MNSVVRLVVEIVILVGLASTVALAFNSVRDRGLRLSKNYFEKPAITGDLAPSVAGVSPAGPEEVRSTSGQIAKELPPASRQPAEVKSEPAPASSHAEHIFQVARFQDVIELYNDTLYGQGIYFFVDARNEEQFANGTIPGARLLNPYYAEDYLPDLLPELEVAERVVVYCQGGDCEDSIFACRELLNAGIPFESIYLYEGGMEDWEKNDGPVESEE